MRDLLDLATEKGVQRFLEQARRVGLPVPQSVAQDPTDQVRFDEELGGEI